MTNFSSTWRLIPPIEAKGSIQMSIDDWLFKQHEKGLTIPILRFYTWSNPTISIGRLQKKYSQSWHHLIWNNNSVEVVRRPTGGRAVLHQGDLTYTVIMPLSYRKTLEVYREICTFLIQGWQTLGIALQYGLAKRGYIHNSSCFNTATVADLMTADGSKLIGSAQRRGKRSILQHGSMVLSTDKTLFEMIFNQPSPWNLGLREQLSYDCSTQQIIDSLTEAVQQSFGIQLMTQPFSEQEWQEILKCQDLYNISVGE